MREDKLEDHFQELRDLVQREDSDDIEVIDLFEDLEKKMVEDKQQTTSTDGDWLSLKVYYEDMGAKLAAEDSPMYDLSAGYGNAIAHDFENVWSLENRGE